MHSNEYMEEAPFAVTVCDENGIIIYMNAKSQQTFASYGGAELVGKNLMDCHPPAAAAKLSELLAERKNNAYSIEKNGRHKLIYQSPWYKEGVFAGLVEISLEIPPELPHFKRG